MGNLQSRDQALKVAVVASNTVDMLIPRSNLNMVIVLSLEGVSTLAMPSLREHVFWYFLNDLMTQIRNSDHMENLSLRLLKDEIVLLRMRRCFIHRRICYVIRHVLSKYPLMVPAICINQTELVQNWQQVSVSALQIFLKVLINKLPGLYLKPNTTETKTVFIHFFMSSWIYQQLARQNLKGIWHHSWAGFWISSSFIHGEQIISDHIIIIIINK